MHITRLRLLGFKSFVEPTELWIEPGLTGVVGPNGCGKSNLLEALRWVMGETSYKAMRASAMEDVIFSGTTSRPARGWAEVTMFVDNSARKAPPGFNDSDVLELTRRIERDMGSAYRINGRDVRARDVKLLFEDAATGARSPALVRQGQIGEIVNAKPEQRRRILEDAAGVAGLHTRRHEAELRLRAAEDNLARIGDVLGGLSSQIEGLKRQARQARRYRELSGEIRRAEALAFHLSWTAAQAEVEAGEQALRDALTTLGEATSRETAALTEEQFLSEGLAPLREAEAVKAATLARLINERANFEREAERLAQRRAELTQRLADAERDLEREAALAEEAQETANRLDDEASTLTLATDDDVDRDVRTDEALQTAEATLRTAEARLAAATRRTAEERARRQSLERTLIERRAAADRARRDVLDLEAQRQTLLPALAASERRDAAASELAALAADVARIEAETADAEQRLPALADAASRARDAAAAARLEASRIATEIATLAKVLGPASGTGLPPALDQITVTAGLERALAAALGDDLDAPLDETAAVHWRHLAALPDDPALPSGVEPLARSVAAPPALSRRIAQVGVVDRADGHRLQPALAPGQRLVSREGDLWRWDGFTAAAEAPSAAAVRLAERNRLSQLAVRETVLADTAERTARASIEASAALATAETAARALRQARRDGQADLDRLRDTAAALDRAAAEAENRLSALDEARQRAADRVAEAEELVLETETTLDAFVAADDLDAELADAESAAQAARAAHADLRAARDAEVRERQARAHRLEILMRERARWETRRADAERQRAALSARREDLSRELTELAELPAVLEERRQALLDEVEFAERQRTSAADLYAAGEAALRKAQQELRAAQGAVTEAREARARIEAHLEAARSRRTEEGRRIREALQCAAEDCLALSGEPPGARLPPQADVERTLTRLRTERDRLGGVNLNAEEELSRIGEEHSRLDAERTDVEQSVAKLRGAIGQLNREAKKRLTEAFRTVDGHFRRLFETLFGGGEARLEMIESAEDPLEGGLEIIAKPPGKKPATLSLLSGGEQTLTALSLIFAVFLTNPSPICVLDEVDAPLDDSNVDRFCTLMEKMASETSTRFLVITHHPMTMARMDRLFGVTMAEKGVSQLVSVDLSTAERIIEDDARELAV